MLFPVLVYGAAEASLARSLLQRGEVYGLEMFAVVVPVVALGEQLRGKRIVLRIDNDAAAGESFWGYLAFSESSELFPCLFWRVSGVT